MTNDKANLSNYIALRATSDRDEQKLLLQATNKIVKNKDIEVLPEDVLCANSPYKLWSLSKVQRELLSVHNKLNH